MTFNILHRHRVCLVDCVDLIRSLYSWWEGFWVFFLSHTAPRFQLWFYFHLCMLVVHCVFFPGAALEDLGFPM